MKDTNLLKILRALPPAFLQQWKEWVFADIFNKNANVRQLCHYVMQYAPHFDHPALERGRVYAAIFGSSVYEPTRLHNLTSDLLQLLFDCMAYHNFKTSGELPRLFLMDELFQQELYPALLQQGRRYSKAKAASPLRHAAHFWEEHLFAKNMDAYFLSQPARAYDPHLQAMDASLDLLYLTTKLRIACDMTSRNRVIGTNYECHFLPELEARIEQHPTRYADQPAVAVYCCVLSMLRHQQVADYQHLRTLLVVHTTAFPQNELRTLYDYARNFCINQINNGDSVYYGELLDLYRFLLAERIIFRNGYLTQWDYKNIVTVALRLGQYDWTADFIHHYCRYLPPPDQANALQYNLATYHLERGAYRDALWALQTVRFTDSSYHIGAKIIQLKSYYELGESEAFYALVEAFKVYLLRQRHLGDYRKQANLHFLKIVKRLFALREEATVLSAAAFQQRRLRLDQLLQRLQPLANADWLREKWEER